MERVSIYIVLLCNMLVAAVACTRNSLSEDGYGYLRASVLQDDNIRDVIIPQLKSGEDGTPVFRLDIYDMFGDLVESMDDCGSVADEPLRLHAGSYKAVVSSSRSGAAAFDTPFYSGSSEFDIETGKEANVEITATIADTKVTVEYSEEVIENFDSYVFTVSNGAGELIFSSDDGTSGKEGYFSVTGTLDWSLSLVNKDGTRYEDLTGTLENVAGGQHYKFVWTLAEEPEYGGGAVTVILDDGTNDKEYTLVLDPDDSTVPVLSAGFDDAGTVTVEIGTVPENLVVTVTSEDGFRNMILTYPDPSALGTVRTELAGASQETVSALADLGIKTAAVGTDDRECVIDLNSFVPSLPIGTYEIGFFAVDSGNSYLDRTLTFEVITDKDAEMVSVVPWALFADVNAKWFAQTPPDGLGFQYRKTSEDVWTDFSGEVQQDAASRTFSTRLTDLDPETGYLVRAVSADDKETGELSFVTGPVQYLDNLDFDSWSDDRTPGGPWDSANKGSSMASIYPTVKEQSHLAVGGEGKAAVKMESMYKSILGMNIFAAGNLYTGAFVEAVISPMGAKLDWGTPFTAKPVALKGYYHYLPKTVNRGTHNDMNGKMDIGQVQIMLTDWDAPFRVNTSASQFVDPQTDPGIIAYGTMDFNETEGYEPFTLRLEYRDLTRTPKYIVIVAAASKYGDYFTGGEGSVLYVDEFSLVYDPALLEDGTGL